MWGHGKPAKSKSRAELELEDALEYVGELEKKLRQLEAVVDALYFKAQISHSLLVVSKISEEDFEKINRLLKVPIP